jgi:sirohydrochlorin cobaltochelatase
MSRRIRRVLENWLAAGARGIGQVEVRQTQSGFVLTHRDDTTRPDLALYRSADDAGELAKFDDQGNYRPLKTAPNLRHDWRLELPDLDAMRSALDLFYPGRLAALTAWEAHRLRTTPFRDTLNRQTGMYRSAAKISDRQVDALVGRFCRSQGGQPGCLRTILWPRDNSGARPSVQLPLDKSNAQVDQTGRGENVMPLLCQEACALLVAEARAVVKGDASASPDE